MRRDAPSLLAARRVVGTLAAIACLATALAPGALAVVLPSGFQESVVFSGLVQPTDVEFASDGRVFVAEKSGLIKVFDNLSDTTPTIFADLRTNTHNYWDRGLLGLALHPNFPATPYVYVLYTLDAMPGGTPPTWGSFGGTADGCPDPPGPTSAGCVVMGRVSRLTASGNVMTGTEQVLLENWCQQYPSHSIGTIGFGPDGALYVSGGEGASFLFVDYGQQGYPLVNPCGDPPGGIGGNETPPSAEGGALRSQDIQTLGDPVSYGGTVIRLDPITGASLPDNPLAGGTVAGDDPIIAYGLRNPFRITMRPGTSEIWIGDVGWDTWEEIDRIGNTTDTIVENFGWPCYEGIGRQPGYEAAGLTLCQNLYGAPGAATDPFFQYNHFQQVVPDELCPAGSSSISGLAFYGTGSYPDLYNGALFFADYSRGCIWAMPVGPSGDPEPANRLTFAAGATYPVDLKIGPGGDLFYVDLGYGTIRRIRYIAVSQPPLAVIDTDVTNGPLPLTVHFDGSASSDPDPGDTLSYAWDLDGDGLFDDSTALAPSYTYTVGGQYSAKLRVTDPHGATDTESVTITAGNTRPTASIILPVDTTTWNVGSTIVFGGSATDAEDGVLPPSALTWTLVLHHCPSNCHTHTVQSFQGIVSGSFAAPDHDYPMYLELRLTVTDSGGLTDTTSVFLDPNTVDLTFKSNPSGLKVAVGSGSGATPFTRTVIVGSSNSISAPAPQLRGGYSYDFVSWSDGGAQSHNIIAPTSPKTYTATFATSCGGSCDDQNPCTTDTCDPQVGCTHTPAADGASCSDGNACNGAETCQAGSCAAGTAPNCNDQNVCTTDTCVPATGCAHTPVANGTTCSDGNACNGAETCQAGSCTAGTAPNCNDQNVCTTDTCVPATGCAHTPVANGTTCSDGNACNGAETCQAGSCTAGTAPNCNDQNVCTTDTCVPATGCAHTPVANGTTCSDGNACNGAETCQAGSCTAGTAPNCNDQNVCTTDTCVPATGCAHTPVANGTTCSDGNACNGPETCQAGSCTAGTAPNCNDQNVCTTDACDPTIGCTHAAVADGTTCSDGKICNGSETCQAGVCTGGPELGCDDGNPCTADGCDDATPSGCVHVDKSALIDVRPTLVLGHLDRPGAGTLSVRGEVGFAYPFNPALDPSKHGVWLQLVSRDGKILENLTLPSGARTPGTPRGWSVNASHSLWRYDDRSGTVQGIRSARVQLRTSAPGRVRISVSGRQGTYAAAPGDEPLTLRALVGTTPTQCAAVQFASGQGSGPVCRFNSKRTTLRCR